MKKLIGIIAASTLVTLWFFPLSTAEPVIQDNYYFENVFVRLRGRFFNVSENLSIFLHGFTFLFPLYFYFDDCSLSTSGRFLEKYDYHVINKTAQFGGVGSMKSFEMKGVQGLFHLGYILPRTNPESTTILPPMVLIYCSVEKIWINNTA